MHTITTRPPTPEEQRVLADEGKSAFFGSLGCVTIFFGIIPVFLLGMLGGWVGGSYGRWVGWAAGVGILLAALVFFLPYERRRLLRARRDSTDSVVQDIAVSEPRVLEIGLINDNEPILAFDLGEQKILFLQGQWLRDPDTYGAPALEGDPEEEILNGLPEPYSFPSSAFTVTRLPHSGQVLSLRVQGAYLPPEKEVEALQPEYEFGDSELFDGSLDDIAGVLARAHAERLAGARAKR